MQLWKISKRNGVWTTEYAHWMERDYGFSHNNSIHTENQKDDIQSKHRRRHMSIGTDRRGLEDEERELENQKLLEYLDDSTVRP